MGQSFSHAKKHKNNQNDEVKYKIKLLELEKKNLLKIIFLKSISNSVKPRTEREAVEGDYTSSFKIKYPTVYIEILKSQIYYLKSRILFAKSINTEQLKM